ncbi:TMV resistance protein N-like [Prunus avium]|uniref:ADP-ribosyl cyclase/cyclic ADP-ribose hydrolase n=1 Tax=Prunus avium TaxID=42229 RepID=A0A6P5SGN6_PRUAV|nr:TMV resistance protein N-like [Prunus avium]
MESIEFFQVFIIIIILIMTLFYMYFRSLTSSSSSSTSSVAAVDTDIPPLQEKYDVFISFRGEDTRLTFTSHLYDALCRKKIETYIDYRLVRGDEIAPALLEAIERSTISVIIFSKNYASSTWCLDELVHILECKEKKGQLVVPIFYDISPSDVRKQKGNYALAFRQLEKRFKDNIDKVHKWRDALTKAANLSGFDDSEKTESEAALVKKVVDDIWTKLIHESLCDIKGLVGIKSRIQQIESLLCLDSVGVCCVGIWGMGGIGKTTLADAVFHRHSSKFEVCCFLANVRERSDKTDGLNDLRNALVGEILKDKDVNINTPSIPSHILIRLRRTKVLIVLDDVNARKQLEHLVGDDDQFCQGSRIIITARDKGLLEQKVDREKIYNVEGLGSDEALRLFHSHAFGNKSPTTDYTELSREVVDYIKGIPLALKVMGSSFRRCKSKQEWEFQWKKVKRVPIGEIDQVLRVSYDGLDDNEKEIFLDIACFYKGYLRKDVERMLDSCDFFGEVGINDLIDRSLISFSQERIEMHDLVQEMGRAIARKQGSRLFNADDVYKALTNNQRDGDVQAICLNWFEIGRLHLESEHVNFDKMYRLRLLSTVCTDRPLTISFDLPNSLRYLGWNKYPMESLPSTFSAQNLVVLEITTSDVVAQLWTEDQSLVNLKWINLHNCTHLTEVPNLSRSRKIEHINLSSCISMVEIPSYFQHLDKLTHLDLGGCKNIKILPEMPCNLEFLILTASGIEELPSSVWSHEKISHLDIKYCKHLKSLPSNTCKLKLSGSFSLEDCESLREFWELPKNTTAINMASCINLVSLPANIWKLKSLERLDLSNCSNFQHFPEISEAMEHLEFLNLSGTTVKELHPSIENLVALRELDLSSCENLEVVPDYLFRLTSLQELNLHYCSKFQNFPEISEVMEHLEFLNLSGTAVKELHPSIENLVALRKLDLSCCNLEVVSDYLFRLTSLQELNLSSTKIKSLPASIKQAAQLSRLCLRNCMSLESLPELPPLLQHLEADVCTSLKTVSSSSTAITQGWEEYIFSRGLHEKHIFSYCPKLDENARSNIMGDAQLRIMRMAIASSKFKEDKIEEAYDSYYANQSNKEFFGKRSLVAISCWGYEIPDWFSHQSEGSSIKIMLPRDWFSTDFLGFALSLVLGHGHRHWSVDITCKYNFKTR